MVKVSNFDVSEHINNEEVIAEFLTAAQEENNPIIYAAALAAVIRARELVIKRRR